MPSLAPIVGVARYEFLLLWRSTRFRLLGGLGAALPVLLGILLALLEARGVQLPGGLSSSAYLPFYLYCYLQALVVPLVVGDFRAADEGSLVAEVVAARPVATGELILGRYLGTVAALALLCLGVCALTAAIQAAKLSLLGSPFAPGAYAVYLVVMALPALLYTAALAFLLGAILRQQAAVAVAAIAYSLVVVLFLGDRYDGLFDFGAFYAPLRYSEMMGFGDLRPVVEQRLLYVALAVLFLGLAAQRYPRLPQSTAWRRMGWGAALASLVAAAGLGHRLDTRLEAGAEYRRALLAEQRRAAARPAPRAAHYDLRVEVAPGHVPLRVEAAVRLRNPCDVPLDTVVLTLNPGLDVRALRDAAGHDLSWRRGAAVIDVALPRALAPGAEMALTVQYEGDIDRDGFDLERTAPRLAKARWPCAVGDLTAWVRPASVFLPPRCAWYPLPGAPYAGAQPASFATAELRLSVPAGLVAITQGQPAADSAGRAAPPAAAARATSQWQVEQPVPGLSLHVGRYDVYEARLNGVDCALYLHPGHAHQAEFFADAADDVAEGLDQLLDAIEIETGLLYPYERLALVEMPLNVQWYYEGWHESGGLAEPGILMVEEDIVADLSFHRDFAMMSQRFGGSQDPLRMKRDLLTRALFHVFLRPEGPRSGLFRSPVRQLWSFDRDYTGEWAGLLERGVPAYLQVEAVTDLTSYMFSRGRGRMGGGMRGPGGMGPPPGGGASPGGMPGAVRNDEGEPWDTLIVRMQQQSLADMDPRDDPDMYRAILEARGRGLFQVFEAVLGEEGFADALYEFSTGHRHEQVSFAEFERAVLPEDGETGQYLRELVREWLYGTEVPGYTLTRTNVEKMDDGWGMLVYQVTVRIRNGEPGHGYVQVTVSSRDDEVVKGVEIGGGEEVEVSLGLWDRPFRVMVEPFLARNQRPLVAPLQVPEEISPGFPESYVRLVPEQERFVSEIVVDNDDGGFSMPVRRRRRYLRPALEGGNWETAELPFAYGRYETSFRWKEGGDGAQPAVWTTRLPRAGEYDVAYYFVPPQFGRRFGLTVAGAFHLTVHHADRVDTLTLHADELEGGWNLLGRFSFEEGEESRVELSDRAGGRLYADAVRWRYIDPRNPEVAYEEDLATWGNSGRGRGGPGGGPPPGEGRGAPAQSSWWSRLF